jgi:CRP/FNR family transcriptional regulator, global nitrogen regulator
MHYTTQVGTASLYDLLTEPGSQWSGYLRRRTFARGKIIYQPGDPSDVLYLIHSGCVRTYRLSAEGRELTFGLLGEKDTFGELGLVGGTSRSSFAEVLEDAEISLLSKELFEELLRRHPEALYTVLGRIGERLRQAEDLIEDLVNRDVASRVARTLLQLSANFGRQSDGGVVIDLRLPYQEIANMVGSTRETVTRAISQMQQNNWVRLEQGRLHLIDNDALATLGS